MFISKYFDIELIFGVVTVAWNANLYQVLSVETSFKTDCSTLVMVVIQQFSHGNDNENNNTTDYVVLI